jgi:LytS/YehU family sensor histidine kinase
MNLSGYDLQDVTFKLKRMTEILLDNQMEQADALLSEIEKELKVVEAKGPEQLKRERRLVWLEVYGDMIQQLAIFAVIALILLRFSFVKEAMALFRPKWNHIWKLVLSFTVASTLSALLGLIRYGQSSWSFVDSQVIWIGIAGLLGGFWAGLVSGALGALFRFLIVPEASSYLIVPVILGCLGGVFQRFWPKRPIGLFGAILAGFLTGFLHSLFMYVPLRSYLPWYSFAYAVLFLSFAETCVVLLFFLFAQQAFKEAKRKQTERELLRTRLQFLQAQINPHFLFNTLNTIAAVCGEENAERARDLIIQLSTFFRRLTKREGDFVSLQDELEYIDAYLNIEKARFGNRLNIEKEIRLSESGLRSQIPILVLQPIVENAVKHGLSKKKEGGTIIIRASEAGALIVIEIEDTGLGMNAEKSQALFLPRQADKIVEDDHAGIGMRNIYERMSRLFGDQFHMVVSSAIDRGTTIKVAFPRIIK